MQIIKKKSQGDDCVSVDESTETLGYTYIANNGNVDKYSLHEACDRSHVIAKMFEEHLYKHHAVVAHNPAKEKSEEIMKSLSEFYQICAGLSLEA